MSQVVNRSENFSCKDFDLIEDLNYQKDFKRETDRVKKRENRREKQSKVNSEKKNRKTNLIVFKHATIRFGSLRAELVVDIAIEEQSFAKQKSKYMCMHIHI